MGKKETVVMSYKGSAWGSEEGWGVGATQEHPWVLGAVLCAECS